MSKQKQFRKLCRERLQERNSQLSNKFTIVPKSDWLKDGVTNRLSVWQSRQFLVQIFDQGNEIIRLSITKREFNKHRNFADGISWDELQRIKNELGYTNQMAVEIYPEKYHTVNDANMRHLWILPHPLDFAWKQPAPNNIERSCLNCGYCEQWELSGELGDPIASGWICHHESYDPEDETAGKTCTDYRYQSQT